MTNTETNYIETYKKVLLLSRLCYETIRGYSNSIGEDHLDIWYETSDNIREFVVQEVLHNLSNEDVSVEEAHSRWCKYMKKEGWKFGESIDCDKKEHHNLVDYDDLKPEQKSKYHIFRTLCNFHKE